MSPGDVVRFNFLRFVVGFILLYAIFLILPMMPLQTIMASAVGMTLKLVGITSIVNGPGISTSFGEFYVVKDCLGISSIAIFVSLMFATSGLPNKDKLKTSLLSLIVFPIWNYLRIVISLALGKTNFQVFHFALWSVSIVTIMVLYYFSLRASANNM